MSTMSLALARSNSLTTMAYEHALQLKAAGSIDMTPSFGMTFGAMRDQAANRERYSLFRGWLYAAINALASEAAGQPAVVAKMIGASKSPKGQKTARTKMTTAARVKASKQEFEVLMDHVLIDKLEKPNPIQNRWQFVYNFVASINLTGWGYIVGGENEEGEYEFYSVPSTWVTPDHKEGPFSRFKVRDPNNPSAGGDDDWLTRENVAFAMLPNPADPRMALPPAQSQIQAVRIDDYIQASQEQFFDNGIFPGAIVTIGKDPHPDVPGGVRPRLTATQRRQVMGAIRKVMAGVANYGNPAIIDGLIESIERLSMTSNEMGWEKSEQAARTRLLSAFSVHPYILGEPVAVGGYAQVVNIEKRFYKRVNTFLDMLGSIVTSFVGGMVGKETSEDLLVWWEECQSVDPSLRWSNLNAARTRGDISRNEIRTELGLPPDESGGDATKNFTSGDITAIVAVQTAVAEGKLTPPQAQVIYETCFDMSAEDAKKLAGKAPKPTSSTEGQPQGPPPPETEEEAVGQATEELKKAVASLGLSVVSSGLPSEMASRLIAMVGAHE